MTIFNFVLYSLEFYASLGLIDKSLTLAFCHNACRQDYVLLCCRALPLKAAFA